MATCTLKLSECGSRPYDVAYPSPIPLEKLSSIAVAVQLWRFDLNQHLSNDLLNKFCETSHVQPKVTMRDIIPNTPSMIDHMVGKFKRKLVSSTCDWLQYHFDHIFKFHRDTANDILRDFDDIVCDYDGTIDYVRTARKMLFCDRISLDEKFKIACTYSFEESIWKMGHFVQSRVHLEEIDFDTCPLLYYWVCCLRNELGRVPNENNGSVDDLMLGKCSRQNRSSFEYFWKRAGLESRYMNVVDHRFDWNPSFFGRFIVPKLDKRELANFLAVDDGSLVYHLWKCPRYTEYVLPIWMYIKDVVDETNFRSMIEEMLRDEANKYMIDDAPVKKSDYDSEYLDSEHLSTCCEIWTSAAANVRQSAVKKILQNGSLSKRDKVPSDAREIRFLMTLLLDATAEDRRSFWLENWMNLCTSTRTTDLQRIMKLCFSSQTEIDEFKFNTMAKYENLIEMSEEFFVFGCFAEFANLLKFCCPDEQTNKDMKRQLLQSSFLVEFSRFSWHTLSNPLSMHEFIEDAYSGNSELTTDFRCKFLSASHTVGVLSWCIDNCYFVDAQRFLESFESTGQNVEQFKKRFIDDLRDYLIEGSVRGIDIVALEGFINWCLPSEEKVIEFMQSISPDEVLRNMVKNETPFDDEVDENDANRDLVRYPRDLDQFLLWYFKTPEKINEFKTRSADVFRMLAAPDR